MGILLPATGKWAYIRTSRGQFIPRAIQIPWSTHMSNITQKAILTISFFRRISQHCFKWIPWSTHISNSTQKAILSIGFLRRISQHCSKLCSQTTNISLARTVMEYGGTKLEKGNRTNKKCTKKERRRARFISNWDYRSRSTRCITILLSELNFNNTRAKLETATVYILLKTWRMGRYQQYYLHSSPTRLKENSKL